MKTERDWSQGTSIRNTCHSTEGGGSDLSLHSGTWKEGQGTDGRSTGCGLGRVCAHGNFHHCPGSLEKQL